ncbi:MAG: hypothetical protein FJ308_08645 [Planctomycetes bacterium]|nr:hypothetical protein [Planctomycetota bacterium]
MRPANVVAGVNESRSVSISSDAHPDISSTSEESFTADAIERRPTGSPNSGNSDCACSDEEIKLETKVVK